MSGILDGMSESRLLALLSLLQTPREWPGGELAERLGVSRRTVRRDVERLRDLGYPVEAAMGATGGYRLVAGTAMPPLLLDDEEAVAITVGLSTAAGQPVRGIEEASVRALAKLEQVLPVRLRHRVRSLGAPPSPCQDSTARGWTRGCSPRWRWRWRAGNGCGSSTGRTTGRCSRRLVDPHRLVAAGRRWYLLGHDLDRDDWRIFRLDRVGELQATGVRVVPREPPGGDAAAYVAERLYSVVPTYAAVVTLRCGATEPVRALGEVTPLGEDACRVRMHADTLDWLAFRLLALDCEFEVHDPPELVARLRTLAARLTRAAG